MDLWGDKMGMSDEEWRKLKSDEIYGMYCRLDEKLDALNKRMDAFEKRLKRQK